MYRAATLVKANHNKHPKDLFAKAINRKRSVLFQERSTMYHLIFISDNKTYRFN